MRITVWPALAFISSLVFLLVGSAFSAEVSSPNEDGKLRAESAKLLAAIPAASFGTQRQSVVIAPELRMGARQLRERLVLVTDAALANPPVATGGEPVISAGLPTGWGDAVVNSFRASLYIEWPHFSAVESELRGWWKKLSELRKLDQEASFPKTGLMLTDVVVKFWVYQEPERCLALVQEAEGIFNPEADARTRDWWQWNCAFYDQELTEVADKLPGDRRSRILTIAHARAEAFWARTDVPLQSRTDAVAASVRYLYSSMRLNEAVELVARWEKEHPEVLQSFKWLIERYFVAANAKGDQRDAAATFHRIEELAAKGSIDPASDMFKLVSQHYYRRLPDSMLLYQEQAHTVVEKQKQQLKPSPK
jgi:hypothetical protein